MEFYWVKPMFRLADRRLLTILSIYDQLKAKNPAAIRKHMADATECNELDYYVQEEPDIKVWRGVFIFAFFQRQRVPTIVVDLSSCSDKLLLHWEFRSVGLQQTSRLEN